MVKQTKIEIKAKFLQEYIGFFDRSRLINVENQLISALTNIKTNADSSYNKSASINSFKALSGFFNNHFSSDFYNRFDEGFFNNTNIENIYAKIIEIENFIKKLKTVVDFAGEILIYSTIESNSISRGFLETLLKNKNYTKITFKKDFSLNPDYINEIRNVEVRGTFQILNSKKEILICDSTFYSGEIDKIQEGTKIVFKNCSFLKNQLNPIFNFGNCKCDEISIEGGTIESIIKFEKNKGNKIKIISVNTSGIKRGNILLERLKNVSEITIGGTNKKLKVNSLELSKVYKTDSSGLILLYNIECNNFIYHGSTNIPKLSISGAKIDNLEFSEIDLGKSMFNNLELLNIYLNGANLNECILNDIDFKGNYKLSKKRIIRILEDKKTIIPEISNSKLKDNYRQLKFIMDKNGNHTEANIFYAKEMEYYEKTKKIDNTTFYQLILELYQEDFSSEKSKEIGEIMSLKFSKYVNEFGNNWLKPTFLLLNLSILATLIHGAHSMLRAYGNDINNDNIFLIKLLQQYDLISLFSIFLFISMTFFIYKYFDFFYKLFEKIVGPIFGIIIILFLLFIGIKSVIPSFNFFEVFAIYINPIGLLPEYSIINGEKVYIVYNGIERLSFVVYKILYGIILWHLIVAAKRTTRR
ncbi:hypothetical protein LAT59_00530 [Candidatus Gracilibacteria bacterium]|nr:hypothetical protein [Candidatus Gracilibacteria bacterium]